MNLIKLVATFLPWFIYPFFPALAIVASLVVATYHYRQTREIFVIEWASVFSFCLGFSLITLAKNSWYAHYESIFITSIFALITWLSLLFKRPFTMQYAKLQVSKQYWDSFLFLRINTLMTASYGLLFSLISTFRVIGLLYPDLIPFYVVLVPIIAFKIAFIRWFPDWYKKRYFRQQKVSYENQSY